MDLMLSKLWRALFETPAHLDSIIARTSTSQKDLIAKFLPAFLRAPVSYAQAFGLELADDEPWTFTREQLVAWEVPEQIFGSLQRSAQPEIQGSSRDFPPEWVEEVDRDWGIEVRDDLVHALTKKADICLRVQGERTAEKVLRSLDAQGSPGGRADSVLPRGIRFSEYVPLLHSEAFKDGWYEIQDVGSQLMALFTLDPEGVAPLLSSHPTSADPSEVYRTPDQRHQSFKIPGTVIDACAGAGGKTLALADLMHGRSRLYAYDVSERKIQALRRRMRRTHYNNVQGRVVVAPSELSPFHGSAGAVLIDAPCSGWGVLRRNPDLKWPQKPGQGLERLSEIQDAILDGYAPLVATGGSLVYGVCTFRKAETTERVSAFSRRHPEFELAEGGFVGPGWSDGFFMQRWVRR